MLKAHGEIPDTSIRAMLVSHRLWVLSGTLDFARAERMGSLVSPFSQSKDLLLPALPPFCPGMAAKGPLQD